jgi:hypothetical protein
MNQKEKTLQFMSKCFGPSTANQPSYLEEQKCVTKAKKKILRFIGEQKLQAFEEFLGTVKK